MDLTHGGNYVGHDGDHDESDCSSRAWVKTLAHNALVNLLVVYLRFGLRGGGGGGLRGLRFWLSGLRFSGGSFHCG